MQFMQRLRKARHPCVSSFFSHYKSHLLVFAVCFLFVGVFFPMHAKAFTDGTQYVSTSGYVYLDVCTPYGTDTYRIDCSVPYNNYDGQQNISYRIVMVSDGTPNYDVGLRLNGYNHTSTDGAIGWPEGCRQFVMNNSLKVNRIEGYHISMRVVSGYNEHVVGYEDDTVWYWVDTNACGMTNYGTPGESFVYSHFSIDYVPNDYTVNYNGNGATSGSMSATSTKWNQWTTLSNNEFHKDFTVNYNANGGTASRTKDELHSPFLGWYDPNTYTYDGYSYAWYTFEAPYYAHKNPDALRAFGYNKQALLSHFVQYTARGAENRSSSKVFDLAWYANAYSDLIRSFGGDKFGYLDHWNVYGYGEGRAGNAYHPVVDTSVADVYPNGASVANLTNVNGGNVTLLAKWGNVSTTLPTPTRSGYTFLGWSTDPNTSTGSYKGGQTIGITGNTTLYAIWRPNSYTMTLKTNGGTTAGSTADRSYTVTTDSMNYNDLSSLAAQTVRRGYSFKGWWRSDFYQVYNNSGRCVNEGLYWSDNRWRYPGDLVLYANWIPNQYTLTLNPNGGSSDGSTDNKSYKVTYDFGDYNDLSVLASKTTRRGYTFQGWYTEKNGGTKIYNADGTITNDGVYWKANKWYGLSDLTLYAHWTANNYTVILDPNAGVIDGSTSACKLPVTYDSNTNSNISSHAVSRTGYRLDGWYTEKNGGTKIYESSGKCTNDGVYWKSNKWYGLSDITLYAHWTPNKYYIQFDGNATNGMGTVTGSMPPIELTYDVATKLPANAFSKVTVGNIEYKDGELVSNLSVFKGWSTDPTALEPMWTDEQDILNLTAEHNKMITFYAIWDDCPNFIIGEFPDRYFTLAEAQGGVITEEELLSTVTVYDREQNPLPKKTSADVASTGSDEGVVLYNYSADEFLLMTSPTNVSMTYRVKDDEGSVAYLTITVYVTDNDPSQRVSMDYVRNIAENYYDKTPEQGGLSEDSQWKTNDVYSDTLRDALTTDNSLYEHSFSSEDLGDIRDYVDDNGFGNSEDRTALQDLFDQYQ